jgi:N-sulfoglucosamine sulfohydrolase
LRPDDFGNPSTPFPGDREQVFHPETVVVPPFLHDAPEVRAELAEYYQAIARIDRGLGRLVGLLREAGCYDETCIVYLSDNGAAFPVAKTTLYDPGMHLPLVVKPPGGRAGPASRSELVSWTDLVPTLLDLAEAPPPPGSLPGRSFVPLLGEGPVDWPDEVFASHSLHQITGYYPMRVLRSSRHKFILNLAWPLTYPTATDLWRSATWQSAIRTGTPLGGRGVEQYLHRPRLELYDLVDDPLELRNVADRPEHRALVEESVERLQRFQADTADPWLHKWEYE